MNKGESMEKRQFQKKQEEKISDGTNIEKRRRRRGGGGGGGGGSNIKNI